MATATLDTHRVVKRLREAEFSDAQAETVTDVLAEATGASMADLGTKADLAELATKAELAELRAELALLRSDLQRVEERLNARIEALEQRMTIKLGSMLAERWCS